MARDGSYGYELKGRGSGFERSTRRVCDEAEAGDFTKGNSENSQSQNSENSRSQNSENSQSQNSEIHGHRTRKIHSHRPGRQGVGLWGGPAPRTKRLDDASERNGGGGRRSGIGGRKI